MSTSNSKEERERELRAEAFSRLVKALHGRPLPWWLHDRVERARQQLEAEQEAQIG